MIKFKNLQYAIHGICQSVATEKNLRIELGLGLLAVTLGVFLNISVSEWTILILLIGSIISAELINTAIEHVVDMVSPQYQPLAQKAKDAAAGAVLILALTSLVIGGLIFAVKIKSVLFSTFSN